MNATRPANKFQSKMNGSESFHMVSTTFDTDTVNSTIPLDQSTRKGLQFWIILLPLLICLFLALLEAFALATILPVIISDLEADQFIWVSASYGIASTALLPFSGGFAEIFGRRPIMLSSIALFALGSAIGGAAKDMDMLIAGRTLQGAGAGGITALTQIILSDLVSLQERGKYNGLFQLTWALGGGIGPVVGGGLARHTVWRWLFYLNIPLSCVCLMLLATFLNVPTPAGTVREKIGKIDWIGNLLVSGATCACVIGLTWGGVVYSWHSARVLLPLCISGVAIALLGLYEKLHASHPVIPLVLLSNSTSLSGYVQIALASFMNVNLMYYMPIYYQACKDASPIASGVDVFGFSFSTAPFSIIAGISISLSGRYRPQIWMSWCLAILGTGLLSTLTEDSSRAKSIGFQIISGAGVGSLFASTYFPVLAPLPVTSNAHALAFFVFCRNLLQVWGFTIGGAVLQNELQHRLPQSILQSPMLQSGQNAGYTLIPLIHSLPQSEKDAVRSAFAGSLVVLWRILVVLGGVGLLSSALMKSLPLHTQRDINWAPKDTHVPESDLI